MSAGRVILDLGRLEAGASHQEAGVDLVVRDAAGEEEPHRVRVVCDLERIGSRVHVVCGVRGAAQSRCHRCLKPFEREVDTQLEVILQRGGQSPDEDVVVVPETAFEFDLTPLVRETLILEEPIRLVCRPDCKGLCPQCGQDRNVGPCECAPPASDPRWEALRQWTDESATGESPIEEETGGGSET